MWGLGVVRVHGKREELPEYMVDILVCTRKCFKHHFEDEDELNEAVFCLNLQGKLEGWTVGVGGGIFELLLQWRGAVGGCEFLLLYATISL